MEKEQLHFSIIINASNKKVWDTMLNSDTYKIWTDIFYPGSYFVGDWSEGSKMLFLAPDEEGKLSGMVSKVKENKPYEYVSLENIGEMEDGKEVVKDWVGALENYTFKKKDGKTELIVDVDVTDELKDLFEGIWPKALQSLKELAEK